VAWLRTRVGNFRATDLYALVTFVVCALLLGSKGFSPQYLVWLLPLLPLVWPNRVGMLYMLGFSIYAYLYFQFWFGDIVVFYQYDGVSLEQVTRSAWMAVLTRTALLLVVASHLLLKVLRPALDEVVPPVRLHLRAQAQSFTRDISAIFRRDSSATSELEYGS
jgi:hypothetical protein